MVFGSAFVQYAHGTQPLQDPRIVEANRRPIIFTLSSDGKGFT